MNAYIVSIYPYHAGDLRICVAAPDREHARVRGMEQLEAAGRSALLLDVTVWDVWDAPLQPSLFGEATE